jgi:signal transduction histidine kinase/CheY-like chemotaxis protein
MGSQPKMHTPLDQSQEIEALLESQALLSNLIESTDAMVWAVDSRDFSLLLYNSAIRDFHRVHHAHDLQAGMSHEEFTPPAVLSTWTGLYERALRHGNFSTEYQTSDGSHTLLVSLGILRREGDVFGISVFGKNLTALKLAEDKHRQLEARIAQSAKMESLGSLAAGIAHDMNNVLGAIQAVAETLQLKHAEDPGLQRALGVLLSANTRGRNLLKGLTNFSRQELRKAEALDLNALIREETEILRHTTFQKVRLALELEDNLPAVVGDPSALASALMNLCVNALDAMHGAGVLTLHTRSKADGSVAFTVEDDGEGMPPEVLARATEPFFTTKPYGKGTGLGLAMVYSTAKAHGGSVEIQSTAGVGTHVTVRLPPTPASCIIPAPPPPPTFAARGLRVLLVDDDELILSSVPDMLENSGHLVTTAASGREALLLLEGGLEAEVVLVDLNMPDMDGFQTLEAIRRVRPSLPALIVTGSQETSVEDRAAQLPRTSFILKPFTVDEISAKLWEMAPLRG